VQVGVFFGFGLDSEFAIAGGSNEVPACAVGSAQNVVGETPVSGQANIVLDEFADLLLRRILRQEHGEREIGVREVGLEGHREMELLFGLFVFPLRLQRQPAKMVRASVAGSK